MSDIKKINSALISVYHKDNLDNICKKLDELGVQIFSTGGTKKFIESLEIAVTAVEDITTYPSILGGRVKTLHPKIFGGILSRRDNEGDDRQLKEYEIPKIDLVIVDLYPFEETIASGAENDEIIEKIDIGGISLIRAAAKNYKDVVVVPSQEQYSDLLNILEEKNGETSIDERKKFALEAFNISSDYDTAIFKYFNTDEDKHVFKESILKSEKLRYGENPHQEGYFYGSFSSMFDQIHGKEISYNNLLDIEAAVNLIKEFKETTFAIFKHNNACGVASRNILAEAWKDALAGDPVSAFGGILITNIELDEETAGLIDKIFFEVIIAPSYSKGALNVLMQKKNRIILIQKEFELQKKQFRTLLNGIIEQDRDAAMENRSDMVPVTKRIPTNDEFSDLEFANILVKHTKSNTIVLAKNRQLMASGMGQTSRVDSLRQAIEKAKRFEFNLEGGVMASDAFFPFPDCVEIANQEGIKVVVQPGGSKRDQDSIDFCNNNNMAMVCTGIRHFKH